MDEAATRREWRKKYVDEFLAAFGATHDMLAPSTQQCMDEWARQVHLILNQPSANWGTSILNLCRAVESELASRLGSISGLEFFAGSTPLGAQAKTLENAKLDASAKQKLNSCGIKPGFIASTLATKLSNLANLRSDTDSAHGGVQIRSATEEDARKAKRLAVDILRGIVVNSHQGAK